MQRAGRMKKELQILQNNPPHGISCWPKNDSLEQLEAQILGPEGTPYEKGTFKIEIQIPERYPFEPPKMSFLTPIYHPNIDNAGRICLDSLKMPPKGAWKPALNISTLLTSLQLLMSEPNPEDPLMADISNEFKFNRSIFEKHAQEWTSKYALDCKTQSEPLLSTSMAKPTEESSSSSSSSSETSDSENEIIDVTPHSKHSGGSKKRLSEDTVNVLRENVKRLKE